MREGEGSQTSRTGLADACTQADVGAIDRARDVVSHLCDAFASCMQWLEYDFDHALCIDGAICLGIPSLDLFE